MVGLEVLLHRGNPFLSGQFQHRCPADALQDVPGCGRPQGSVPVDEEVGSLVLRHVAVDVQEQGEALGIHLLDLELGQGEEDPVPVLELGVQRLGRDMPGRGGDGMDTPLVEVSVVGEPQREGRDEQPGAVEFEASDGAAHPSTRGGLGDPDVPVGIQDGKIGLQHFQGDLLHPLRSHAGIDPGHRHGAVKPPDVLLQLEGTVPEGPGRVGHVVAETESGVGVMDPDLRVRNQPAVEPGQQFPVHKDVSPQGVSKYAAYSLR